MTYKRGDIFFISKGNSYATGCEMESNRPGIIVSNDKANTFAPIVEVVYLTTREKKSLPTHVNVKAKVLSTALCEGVYTVSKERIGEFIRTATAREMELVDKALLLSLGLTPTSQEETDTEENMTKIITERELYKNLYEKLLDKVVSA